MATRRKSKQSQRPAKGTLALADAELELLRDVMSVRLPSQSAGFPTVSQALATSDGRQIIEATLWDKVSLACQERGLALEGQAPDHIIIAQSQPELTIAVSLPRKVLTEQSADPFLDDAAEGDSFGDD